MYEDKTKPHVICVGFHPSIIDSIDFENYRISIIVHDYLAKSLESEIHDKFVGVGVIDVPHNMNLEEYINAMQQIEAVTEQLIAEHGLPKSFVAFYEHVTLPAAILREKYNIPGTSVATATLCRDKIRMKECLQATEIRVPRFAAIDSNTSIEDIKNIITSWPEKLVLKPRAQAASEGVFVFDHKIDLIKFIENNGINNGYEIEEFIEGRLCHFDGVIREGQLRFFSASEYTTTCYNYVYKNIPMASITIDDPQLFEQAKLFTQSILQHVKLENGVFHLEAFLVPSNEFIFLEVANRFGGAGVVPLFKLAYGIDIVKETMLADMLSPTEITSPFSVIEKDYSSAWLYLPIPKKEPCEVKSVSGLDNLPQSVIQIIPVKEGQLLNQSVAPFPSIGRFFLKADSSCKIKDDCEKIIKQYQVILT